MKSTLEQHPTKPTQWRAMEGNNTLSDWHSYEMARRISACWNVCEGETTDELETMALAKLLVKRGKIKAQ